MKNEILKVAILITVGILLISDSHYLHTSCEKCAIEIFLAKLQYFILTHILQMTKNSSILKIEKNVMQEKRFIGI